MSGTAQRLQAEITQLRRNSVRMRYGVVTQPPPDLAVSLGDATEEYENVKALGGSTLEEGDRVPVLKYGNDLLVLGGVGSGNGGGGGGPFQPLDDELTILAEMATEVATALDADSVDDLLGNIGAARNTDQAAILIGQIEAYGHSGWDTGVYDTTPLGTTTSRLSAMIHADIADYSIGGGLAAYAEQGGAGDGGWGTVFRNTESESTSAPYEPRRALAMPFYGVNDLGHLGPGSYAVGEPTMNAMEAIISRLRASAIFECEDAGSPWHGTRAAGNATLTSVTDDFFSDGPTDAIVGLYVSGTGIPDGRYIVSVTSTTITLNSGTGITGSGSTALALKHWAFVSTGSWTFPTQGTAPTLYDMSGGAVARTTTGAGNSYAEFHVPADVPSASWLALCFRTGTSGEGANWTIAQNGTTVTTFDTRDKNPIVYGDTNPSPTAGVSVYRFQVEPGDFIRATVTTIGTNATIDCCWIEATHNKPLVILPKFWQVPDLDAVNAIAYEYTFDQSDWDASRDSMDTLASMFDDDVIVVDLADAIDPGDADQFADVVHVSEKGHGLVARELYAAILGARRTAQDQAFGNAKGSGLRFHPRDIGQNVIQAAHPLTPLTLRQARRDNRPPTFTPMAKPLLSAENRDGDIFAKMGMYGSGNDHGGGASNFGFYTEGFTGFDAIFSDWIDDDDSKPRFAIFGGGAMQWGPGSASATDVILGRSGVGELTVTGDLVVTGSFSGGGSSPTTPIEIDMNGVAGDPVFKADETNAISLAFAYFANSTHGNAAWAIAGGTAAQTKMWFGAGGATALDTNLYRFAANSLGTDDAFTAVKGITSDLTATSGEVGLRVNNVEAATYALGYYGASSDTQPKWGINSTGGMLFGAGGSTAADTNLFRNAANVLRTSDSLIVDIDLTVTGDTTHTGTTTLNDTITIANAKNIVVNTSTGTKIGTGTTQKLGFFNATPVAQQTSTADLRTALINLGLVATGGANPLDLNGGALTAATATTTAGFAANLTATAGEIGLRVNNVEGVTYAIGYWGSSSDSASNPKFGVNSAGSLLFGAGGASAPDTNLFRATNDVLKTGDSFHVGADFRHLGTNVGFYNVTAVARPTAYTQTYSTATRTQSNITAGSIPAGGTGTAAGGWDTAGNRNTAITAINNMQTDLANVKQVLNSVIDDLQAVGLLQ